MPFCQRRIDGRDRMDGLGTIQVMLTPPQKAAVIVRLLLGEGADLPLTELTPEAQATLATEMAQMDMIDRETRNAVISEFCDSLEAVGLSFPGGIDSTLAILGDHLSQDTTNRLRRMAALSGKSDPWVRIAAAPVEQLRDLAINEAVEVAAILVSKLPVPKAAELFGSLPSERARQIAYAISLTGGTEAQALRRIGLALVQALDSLPQPVLEGRPVERVGAILNFTSSPTRDSVLDGLEQEDATFADQVRKAIFTWSNIPQRIDPRDVVRITRAVEPATLLRAMAAAKGDDIATVDFILANISQRLAETMREDMESAGKVPAAEADKAMSEVIAAIRAMEDAGEIFLIACDHETEE